MTLRVGGIVTVTLEGCSFEGKQAKIVEIVDDTSRDGSIGVTFSNNGKYLLAHYRDNSEKIVRFQENELREDSDWTPKNKACQLFGFRMWYTLHTLKEPFNSEQGCAHKSCEKKATSRIMVNAWGVVCEHDVCDAHCDEYHGKCIDLFPTKQRPSGK